MEKYKGCLVFDGDDTLWHNQYKYHLPIIRCLRIVHQIFGKKSLHPMEVLKKYYQLDKKGVTKYGFLADRFPKSWVETYREICDERGVKPDKTAERKLYQTASQFAQPPYPMIKGAKRILKILRKQGYYLVLLTAGDPELQEKKIKHNKLEKYFDKIKIVLRHKERELEKLAKKFGRDSVWMIGNSKKSDISSALKVPIKAVYIPFFTWHYEMAEIDKELYEKYVTEVKSIEELSKIF